jgi:protein associated with RNAse G/E
LNRQSDIGRPIQIQGTSYDGKPHWLHPAYLVLEKENLIVTQTFAGCEVTSHNGPWASPYHTRGHYWTDRWYNVIRLEPPAGTPPPELWRDSKRAFYCNIATPAQFDGASVHYVDLQLDVLAFADPRGPLRYEVRDEDEFEEARARFRYPESLVTSARQAVLDLVALIEARAFPFSP